MSDDRREVSEESSAPTPCVSGCGFFGSPLTANMCSQCYKASRPAAPERTPKPKTSVEADAGAQPASAAAAPVTPARPTPEPKSAEVLVTPTATAATPAAESTPAATSSTKKKKKKRNRCAVCRKKVGITGFTCRCESMFCDKHRYADAHNCTFDYKASHKEQLAKANPVCVAAKVDKL